MTDEELRGHGLSLNREFETEAEAVEYANFIDAFMDRLEQALIRKYKEST
jgi:hypothetical protein